MGGGNNEIYCYNVSGGDNQPGIRRFLPSKLEILEMLEEKFKPRFHVELSKSGELPEKPLLFDPDNPNRYSVKRKRKTKQELNNQIKNIYKCSNCGKKFVRKKPNSILKPHKSKNGMICNGYGTFIGTKY